MEARKALLNRIALEARAFIIRRVEEEEVLLQDEVLAIVLDESNLRIAKKGEVEPHKEPEQIRLRNNRRFKYLQPASLNDEELQLLLSQASGLAKKGFISLLVTHKNQPYCEPHKIGGNNKELSPIWYSLEEMRAILAKNLIPGKHFWLVKEKQRKRAPILGNRFQLWEIQLKQPNVA
ncbi:MAG: hypothetical protein K0S38_717 [Candidatus Paceibacter sp.]|nr:hypothetical protein [Candidatus Paceibacter sp.]